MSETTVSTPAQPARVQIDPVVILSEAKAIRDFLESQSLQNANNAVVLFRRVKELETSLDEQQKLHQEEMDGVANARDDALRQLQEANQKIIEIQSSQATKLTTPRRKGKANG